MAEETLGAQVARFQAAQNKTRNTDRPTSDPMLYADYLPTQNAIDRARTSAQNGMRRAKADVDKIQAARLESPSGVRAKAQPTAALQVEPNPVPAAQPAKPAPTIRTQSHTSKPVQQELPGLCPCDSGREFIDCCAIGRGLLSQKAA